MWTRIENTASSGFPDTVGIYKKRIFFLELKVIEGKSLYFQRSQIAWMTMYTLAGRKPLVLVDHKDGSISLLEYLPECEKFTSGNKVRIPLAQFKNLNYDKTPLDWTTLLETIKNNS